MELENSKEGITLSAFCCRSTLIFLNNLLWFLEIGRINITVFKNITSYSKLYKQIRKEYYDYHSFITTFYKNVKVVDLNNKLFYNTNILEKYMNFNTKLLQN